MGRSTPSASPPAELRDYAGIYAFDNFDPTSIPLVNSWKKIGADLDQTAANQQSRSISPSHLEAGANGDYELFFNAAVISMVGLAKTFEFIIFVSPEIGAAITGASQTNPVVISSPAHGLSDGDFVKIANVEGMVELNNRVFTVDNAGVNSFDILDDGGLGIDGTLFTPYVSGGDAFASRITSVHTTHTYAAGGDIENQSAENIVPLFIRDRVELFVKNIVDASALLIRSANLCMTRLG